MSSLSETEEDSDKPHFNYPYDDVEEEGKTPNVEPQQQQENDPFADLIGIETEAPTTKPDASPFRVGLAGANSDPFGLGSLTSPEPVSTGLVDESLISNEAAKSGFDDLLDGGFSEPSVPISPPTNGVSADPFDLFGAPPAVNATTADSKAEKDPFDLFG